MTGEVADIFHGITLNFGKSNLKLQNIVSDISHCGSRALSENSTRHDVILYVTMF